MVAKVQTEMTIDVAGEEVEGSGELRWSSGHLGAGGSFYNHSSRNTTWLNIVKVGEYIDSLNINFRNSFFKKIGDGRSTSFWNDPWLISEPLKDKFPRLARLDSCTNVKVIDRVIRDGENLCFCGSWVREPRGRNSSDLDHLKMLLDQFQGYRSNEDSWVWKLSSKGTFSTKELTSIINSRTFSVNNNFIETLWNNFVPKKVEVFVWRARHRRIPVLEELDKRGIDLHSVRCPICDGSIESVDHSLILCPLANDIWLKVLNWWGFGGLTNWSINEIFKGKANCVMSETGAKIL
ncbi:uncharacterized protein [Rutidosis leptorrhynchoides]|uniref:uncharacterized protein n=1 Tax=Rutidosis leptorrhynchoides TaxID=125765 RepID=UPI003A98E7DA